MKLFTMRSYCLQPYEMDIKLSDCIAIRVEQNITAHLIINTKFTFTLNIFEGLKREEIDNKLIYIKTHHCNNIIEYIYITKTYDSFHNKKKI